jgi:YHS domain-containing protein
METALYFVFWGLLIFFMMRFGCGSHVMGHGHGGGHSHGGGESARDADAKWVPPEKDVDPVCGMTVATAGAKSSLHEGRVYYFCSQTCREKFEAAPASYAKAMAKPTTPSQTMEHQHDSHH